MKTATHTALPFGGWYRAAVLAVTFVLVSVAGWGQGFEKSFGGNREDFGRAVLQTKDHGYLEVGSSEGISGTDNFDVYVVRTDVDGTLLWANRYDDGGVEQGFDALRTENGDYLIVGYRQADNASAEQVYLISIDERGGKRFSQQYGNGSVDERGQQLIRANGQGAGYLITGITTEPTTDRRDVLLIRINAAGEEQWRRNLGTANRDDEGIGAIPTEDGGFIIGANVADEFGAGTNIGLFGIDADGQLRWEKSYGTPTGNEQIEDIIRTSDGQLAFVGSTDGFNKALIAKADLNGDTLWYREIDAAPFDDELRGLIEEDGGESLVAVGQTVPTGANLDVLMVKVRAADGQPIWQRRLGSDDALDVAEDLAPTLDGGYALAAFKSRAATLFSDMSLFKTDNLGDLQTNYLIGRVYYPGTGLCGPYTEGDLGLSGWLIRAESERATFFGSTDSLGNYELQVDEGAYEVTLLRKNDRWNVCDDAPRQVPLMTAYDTSFQSFSVVPAIDCPLLEVTVQASPAIRCREQVLTVRYGNPGSATATGASIELVLDEVLTYQSASRMPSSQDGQALIFPVGDLDPDQEGSFTVRVLVGCTGVLNGQAIQSVASISPVFNCSPGGDDWDGSSIVVTSRCDREEGLTFTITNIGDSPMGGTSGYVIVEDIALRGAGNFELDIDQSLDVTIDRSELDGSTYRLIAEQSPGHPGALFPTAVAEGCRPDNQGNFVTGQVAQFPDNDGDLHLDILTQEVLSLDGEGSIEMVAYPRGYQDSIIIPNTDIEYTLFFPLPTNERDGFERVVIRDTLPEALDFSTLEMGAGSHPYDFVLYQDGILKITFDSIRFISGGSTGEADAGTRQGYVSFRLSQKPNTLPGSVIRNRAAVYFDYETPVFTREIRQVVGCSDLFEGGCLLTANRELPTKDGVAIHMFPNPAQGSTTVRLEGWDEGPATRFELRLYDLTGRELRHEVFAGDRFELMRRNLAAGAYHYEVSGGGYLLGRGRVIFTK